MNELDSYINNVTLKHFSKSQTIFLPCSKRMCMMEIILEIPDKPSVKGPRKHFCCAWFPKALNGNISLLENKIKLHVTYLVILPKLCWPWEKPLVLPQLKYLHWGGGKFVNTSMTCNVFVKHVTGISRPFPSPELQAYFSNSSRASPQRYPADCCNPTRPKHRDILRTAVTPHAQRWAPSSFLLHAVPACPQCASSLRGTATISNQELLKSGIWMSSPQFLIFPSRCVILSTAPRQSRFLLQLGF